MCISPCAIQQNARIIFLKIPRDIKHRIDIDSSHVFSYLKFHEIPMIFQQGGNAL